MDHIRAKLAVSSAILMLVLAGISLAGLTSMEREGREGLMIDFGYWNVVWTEIAFDDGMDGVDALYTACHINGYPEPVFKDPETRTELYAVNGQHSLTGAEWGFYIIPEDGERWVRTDPRSVKAKDCPLLCWARASGPDTVVPGTDSSGFTYYGYAVNGVSARTGEGLRVVTLAPSLTEMAAAVGGLGCIIGTDMYSDHPKEIVDGRNDGTISVVGGYTDPNYEWILRLSPDIVFCDGGVGEHVTIANKLRKSGIWCVVTYNSTDISTLYDNMWIVGAAMGLEKDANKAIHSLKSSVDAAVGVLGVQPTKRVFAALSPDPSPWTAGSDTFINDIVDRIYGRNIFAAQQSSWFMVAKESIHFNQPEAIFIIMDSKEVSTHERYTEIVEGLDELWKQTPAYRNGDIFLFSGDSADMLSRPGPRLGEAVELLAKALHPSPFLLNDPLDSVPKYFGNDYRKYLTYQVGGSS